MACELAFRMPSILQVLYFTVFSVSVPMLQVREALTKKVSRERVGAELEGMFNGEDIMSADLDYSVSCNFQIATASCMLACHVHHYRQHPPCTSCCSV